MQGKFYICKYVAFAVFILVIFNNSNVFATPPWTPQYKVGGTAADVLGPDGLIYYPNWNKTGVQGGIPNVPVFASLGSYGGYPDDGLDDSTALYNACMAAGMAGGGAILLGNGTYHLDNKVVIHYSNVVIRGFGSGSTSIIIRYNGSDASKEDGVIKFVGNGKSYARTLTADGKRGDTTLQLSSVSGLLVGEWLYVYAPPTERWNNLVGNECAWADFRHYMVRIEEINGNTVRINQPLRIDFPVIDNAVAHEFAPIQNCGIENVYIRQENDDPWIQTVLFHNAVNCWGKGVKVEHTGRNPLYGHTVKWMEIRDCVFNYARNTGSGGTGYVGFEQGWDCLIDNITTKDMRHAPCLEWGSSGCVIKDSYFDNSDAQFHSGWCHENLIENCYVVASYSSSQGTYGHGVYASPPDDTSHGPIGPRNVIYNSDFDCSGAGLRTGGANENWLVLYNRFRSKGDFLTYPISLYFCHGWYMDGVSFDHIIKGNTFVLEKSGKNMITMNWSGSTGVEIIDNKLYADSGHIVGGSGSPSVNTGNQVFPRGSTYPPKPVPEVPSIYDCQQLSADLSGNCIVDFYDLAILAEDWLEVGYYYDADILEDGVVDLKDFAVMADTWGDSKR